MKKVLVIYGTTEGHTRKIATFIAEHLRAQGAYVDLVDSATPAAAAVQPIYGAVVIAGSLHEHLHQRSLVHFVKENVAWLNAVPTAVVSAGLAAAMPDPESQAQARNNLQNFLDATGLKPAKTKTVGGALLYTKYDWFKRTMMRLIARQMGKDVDDTRDHEYTDWDDLRSFIDEFARQARIADGGG
ncbi:MAG: flavodoxin domain-containing protein [Pseudomonadota bacterium]